MKSLGGTTTSKPNFYYIVYDIYIYIYRFFGNFVLSGLGSGSRLVSLKPAPDPNPL